METVGRKAKGPVKWQPSHRRESFFIMRRAFIILLITTMLIAANLFAFAAETGVIISDTYSNAGVVGVLYNRTIDKRIRLLVEKDGTRYTYNIYQSQDFEKFPLQMGDGDYVVRLMENVEGNRYKEIVKKTIGVKLEDKNSVFLNSIQEIKWQEADKAVEKAKELTEGLVSDEEKIKAIYSYITSNVKYDYKKLSRLTVDYLPEIDSILEGRQGICYDYSALFAAMLRSIDIPTKMVKGYTTNVKEYHAWNEVFIEGKWRIVDTTLDAGYIQQNERVEMYKQPKAYSSDKVY